MSKKFNIQNIEKYNKDNYDDLYSCLRENSFTKIALTDVLNISAEVCGESDGPSWWWLLGLKDKKYALVSAGCDSSGWDCGSSITIEEIYDTKGQAVKASPVKDGDGRAIQWNLRQQSNHRQILGIYVDPIINKWK